MTRHVLIAVAVLLIGGAIAHLHVAAQSYQPIVRVATPEGVTYTAALDSLHERPACGAATQRFLEAIKTGCPQCRVVFARCSRDDAGLPGFVGEGDEPSGRSFVNIRGMRISIDAAPGAARRTCQWIAESVRRFGVPSARCVAAVPETPRT